MDAIRISDGAFVTLKRVNRTDHPHETAIASFLSSEPLRSDPHNYCVPVYEVLAVPDLPDEEILVTPTLRKFDDPRFDTVGEAMECLRQIFQVCRIEADR
jgi:hypothetical protein